MPLGNRMGPVGEGPMTGRGAGLCAGSAAPGNMNPGPGRGMGRGGRGGYRHGWQNQLNAPGLRDCRRATAAATAAVPIALATGTPEQQIGALKSRAESLQFMLEQMQKQIEEIEATRTHK
jgi:Family of unknown function (DUF5320)